MRVTRRQLRELKAYLGCCVCAERSHVALHFHHWGQDKVYNVADMVGLEWCQLYRELQKCSVMCRNCHAKCHGDVDAFAVVLQANAKRIAARIGAFRESLMGGNKDPWDRLYARMFAFGDMDILFPPYEGLPQSWRCFLAEERALGVANALARAAAEDEFLAILEETAA